MIIYLCIKFKSNKLIFSKDIERTGRTGRMYGQRWHFMHASPLPPSERKLGYKNMGMVINAIVFIVCNAWNYGYYFGETHLFIVQYGLTNKTHHARSWDHLICKSSNVVYAVECSLYGLMYVGETKWQLRTIMSGHRFEVNHGGNQLLYQHFNLPDNSILSFKIRILEQIYHPSYNSILSMPFRRKRVRHLRFVISQLATL